MQGLKVLVIAMAFAIFAILGVIIVVIVQRAGAGLAGESGFGDLDLAIPAGCAIAHAALSGERLVVRLDGPAAACQQVVVFDLESGRALGRVTGRPAK